MVIEDNFTYSQSPVEKLSILNTYYDTVDIVAITIKVKYTFFFLCNYISLS